MKILKKIAASIIFIVVVSATAITGIMVGLIGVCRLTFRRIKEANELYKINKRINGAK